MNNEIDRILDNAVTSNVVAGATMIVCNSGGIVYRGAAGETGINGQSMAPNSVAAIMSMTKAITGTAAMQLVEQGKLSLDTPAGEVCPYLAEVQVLAGFDDNGEVQLRPPTSPVTLRHLLTHTSGFVYDFWNSDFTEYLQRSETPSILTLQKSALQVPLMFDPGTRWEYGIGIDWTGQMVEAVSGMTLGEYFQANITGPLGMSDTAFVPTPSMGERMCATFTRTPEGTLAALDSPTADSPTADAPPPEFEMGGGGLLSTASDYSQFLRLVLRGGELDSKRLLKPETVRQMATNQMGDLRVTMLNTAAPSFSCDAEFFPGAQKSWGLTFQINEEPTFTGRPAGTLMWAGLSNCFYWIDRKNDLAGVFVSQLLPFADEQVLQTYYDAEQAVYNHIN